MSLPHSKIAVLDEVSAVIHDLIWTNDRIVEDMYNDHLRYIQEHTCPECGQYVENRICAHCRRRGL